MKRDVRPGPPRAQPAGAYRLLSLLRDPAQSGQPTLAQWDQIVRIARMGSIASRLHARYEEAEALDLLPAAVERQLRSERNIAEYRAGMARWVLERVTAILAPLGVEPVVLKGAAWLVQEAHWGRGRLLSDVDLMVSADDLVRVEAALKEAGWGNGELDAYDERYYREWSHELPPLHHPDFALSIDLHHTILPVTSRLTPDAAALMAASVAVAGTSLRVLAPEDQLLHTCCHLFEDSDMWQQMRDLLDIDAMLRAAADDPHFDARLMASAERHGLHRPLFYGLHYSRRFLASPVPPQAARLAARRACPLLPGLMIMDALVTRSLLPAAPDRPTGGARRWARRVLKTRYFLRRFPPRLLARHLWVKRLGLRGPVAAG